MWVWKGSGKPTWGKGNWGKGAKGGWGKGGKGVAGVQKPWLKKADGPIKGEVPKNFAINATKRYKGTVQAYWKLKGYGFLEMSTKGVVPEDAVFVYWTEISSVDRFPMLTKDTEVEFSLKKDEKHGKTVVAATNVTLPGGSPVALQDEQDAVKTFVGGQNLRYTGKLKFFIPKRGYGYIEIDDGYMYNGEEVPKEIRVERSEVNSGGKQPGYMKDVQVEFGIWKTKKDQYKAYNMTAPGGVELASDE